MEICEFPQRWGREKQLKEAKAIGLRPKVGKVGSRYVIPANATVPTVFAAVFRSQSSTPDSGI